MLGNHSTTELQIHVLNGYILLMTGPLLKKLMFVCTCEEGRGKLTEVHYLHNVSELIKCSQNFRFGSKPFPTELSHQPTIRPLKRYAIIANTDKILIIRAIERMTRLTSLKHGSHRPSICVNNI